MFSDATDRALEREIELAALAHEFGASKPEGFDLMSEAEQYQVLESMRLECEIGSE